jgi:DNA polymerase-3 subunit chi
MTEVWFYHLERSPLSQVVPDLLDKVASRGWKAYVHGRGGHEDDTIASLNSQLWAFDPASFLAHGTEEGAFPERQPVLLGSSGAMVNGADVYMSVAPVDLPDVSGTKRCLIVFEGIDDAHVGWARGLWKQLKADGHALAYWKQTDEGRWEKVQ